MSEFPFLNRQALHLRPDPTRVIVRPFKPATEPRDLNPTDKTRANHIVERVLALDPDTAVAGALLVATITGSHNRSTRSQRTVRTEAPERWWHPAATGEE